MTEFAIPPAESILPSPLLVVEDDDDVRVTTRLVLKRQGFDVVTAADGLGLSPAQVGMLWVRDAPGVTAPLLGARTAAQLAPYLDADAASLPAEITSALDDVSGGPNGLRDAG